MPPSNGLITSASLRRRLRFLRSARRIPLSLRSATSVEHPKVIFASTRCVQLARKHSIVRLIAKNTIGRRNTSRNARNFRPNLPRRSDIPKLLNN
jgi:hypothetical protein